MPYKPTTAKYKGRTYTYYLIYDLPVRMRFRNGKVTTKVIPKVRRVYISGRLMSVKKVGNNLIVKYENTVRGYTAKRGYTNYKVRSKKVIETKNLSIPSNTRNIKLLKTLPSKYKKTLMNIT